MDKLEEKLNQLCAQGLITNEEMKRILVMPSNVITPRSTDNAIKGDIIKHLFPNAKIKYGLGYVHVHTTYPTSSDEFVYRFPDYWWHTRLARTRHKKPPMTLDLMVEIFRNLEVHVEAHIMSENNFLCFNIKTCEMLISDLKKRYSDLSKTIGSKYLDAFTKTVSWIKDELIADRSYSPAVSQMILLEENLLSMINNNLEVLQDDT